MSAAAARRKKQLLAKKQAADAAEHNGAAKGGDDAIIVRLNALLAQSKEGGEDSEALAYEALQLAQSQVRKLCVADGEAALKMASNVIIQLLQQQFIGMAAQLSTQLIDALVETHTPWNADVLRMCSDMDAAFGKALEDVKKDEDVYERLQRLHVAFLRKLLKYSDSLGDVRFGACEIHAMMASCLWEGKEYAEAVLHFCLAEQAQELATLLLTTEGLSANSPKAPPLPAAERDALLTRGVIYFLAMENLRDANALLRQFIELDDRDPAALAKSYLDKANKFPTHVTFSSALLRVCETDAAPLYQWLLRSFSKELTRFPDLEGYTTKIGRLYFGIEPPPSMMSMVENMMGMMGGGAGGMMPGMMPPGMMG